MDPYIRNLIREGEHQELDFKFEISDSRKIAWTFSAFANTIGGRILVGVKDNGKIAGIRTEEELHMIHGAGDLYCKPPINPKITSWEISGKIILEVFIKQAKVRPVYAKDENNHWKVWVRVKDENFKANSVLIKSWSRKQKKQGTFVEMTDKEKLFFDYLNRHNTITFSKAKKLLKLPSIQIEKLLVNFLSLKTINIQFTHDGIFYAINKNELD